MRLFGPLLAVFTLVLGGCLGAVDFASNVHDLRILAISAEPPEVVVPFDPRTGTIDPFLAATLLPKSVKLKALVVDPSAAGRTIHYEFFICPWASGLDCTESDAKVLLGEGDLKGDTAETEIPLLLNGAPNQPMIDLITEAQKRDPLKGFGGIPVPVTLRVTEGNLVLLGGKRLVVSFPQVAGQKANVNPPPPPVLLDGLLLLEGDSPGVKQSPAPRVDVFPLRDQVEEYVVPTFQGEPRTLTESWRFSWFSTKGRFSPERTGGAEQLRQEQVPTDTRLVFAADEAPGDFTFYVVERDGRGGEVWVKRTATYLGK